MIRQKSFENQNPTLYLVATPIGNLSECSPRTIEILNTVDIIACEDTRTSKKLLSYFGIHKKLIAYHNFNEKESTNGILKLLSENNNIALVSDAGYPLLCDPGVTLSKAVIENGFNLVPISGSNAALNALVASGIEVHPFYFFGFLSSNSNERKNQINQHKNFECTLIYYESPHRIHKTLNDLLSILGNRMICVARELTKIHEEFIRGNIEELLTIEKWKGELVIVIEGDKKEDLKVADGIQELEQLIISGVKKSEAIKIISKKYNIAKNALYEKAHQK